MLGVIRVVVPVPSIDDVHNAAQAIHVVSAVKRVVSLETLKPVLGVGGRDRDVVVQAIPVQDHEKIASDDQVLDMVGEEVLAQHETSGELDGVDSLAFVLDHHIIVVGGSRI